MNTSGTTSVNSGPLIIRTYNDLTANNTFLLGQNDYPISSNRVLITSTNGILTPSDAISISTINGSTITTNTLLAYSTITCSTLSMFSSGIERIHLQPVGSTILNSGNVGIGTVVATYPVTLYTSTGFGFVHTTTTTAGSTITMGTNIATSGQSSGQVGTISNHPLQFFTGNNTALPSVTVATSGNVGIGSTIPSVTLDVNGSLNVTGTAKLTNVYSGRKGTNFINSTGTNFDLVTLFGTSSPVLLVSVYASDPTYYAVAIVYMNGSTIAAINQLMAYGLSLSISSGLLHIANSLASLVTTLSVMSMG